MCIYIYIYIYIQHIYTYTHTHPLSRRRRARPGMSMVTAATLRKPPGVCGIMLSWNPVLQFSLTGSTVGHLPPLPFWLPLLWPLSRPLQPHSRGNVRAHVLRIP